jgi:hypothetical protein
MVVLWPAPKKEIVPLSGNLRQAWLRCRDLQFHTSAEPLDIIQPAAHPSARQMGNRPTVKA